MSGLKLSTGQVKAGRALLGWSQDRLADASGVSAVSYTHLTLPTNREV